MMRMVSLTMPRAGALGLGLGAVWGVLSRVWMRLISTEPEFSWSGTLAIIGFSALLGLGVGVVHGARRSGRSRWWTLAVVPGLVLFMSPGMLLAPCFLLGGLAWGSRGRVGTVVGVLAVALSVVAGGWVQLGSPDPGESAGVGDVLVFATGYLAMALTLAWASSLVWQRSATHHGEPDNAARARVPSQVHGPGGLNH